MNLRHCILVAITGAIVGLPRPADAVDPRNPRDYRVERISANTTYSAPRVGGVSANSGYGYNVDPTYGYDPFQQPFNEQPAQPGGFTPLLSPPDTPLQPVATPGRGRAIATNGVQSPFLDPSLDPAAPKKNRWRIGIRSKDTDSGVLVMQVLDGSPGKIAGLEVGDRIVAVGGYQVGIVNGERYDLGSEFDLRCDENGTTFLLVQNNRDGSLITLPTQLEPRFSTVSGELVWRSKRALPRESYAVVELREIVRPGARPITIAEQKVSGLKQSSQTGKIPFEIEYDPSEIQANRRYVIHSQITDGYRVLYHTDQLYPVITMQNPRRVDVSLAQIYDWTGGQQTALDDTAREWETFVSLFRKYMGRPLREEEVAIYRNEFEHGSSLQGAMIDVVGSPEFYQRCNADDRSFIVRAYQMRNGKNPTEREIQYWLTKLQEANHAHRTFARDLVSQLN